jgi:hypothetical protein
MYSLINSIWYSCYLSHMSKTRLVILFCPDDSHLHIQTEQLTQNLVNNSKGKPIPRGSRRVVRFKAPTLSRQYAHS